MDMTYLELEIVGEDILITCDRLSAQSIRQGILRHDIRLTPDDQTVTYSGLPLERNEMRDLVEFRALSVSEDDVRFALQDSLKIIRPYPRKVSHSQTQSNTKT